MTVMFVKPSILEFVVIFPTKNKPVLNERAMYHLPPPPPPPQPVSITTRVSNADAYLYLKDMIGDKTDVFSLYSTYVYSRASAGNTFDSH